MSYLDGGLFKKFKVIRVDTGEEVTDKTFTLIPERNGKIVDWNAVNALLEYADCLEWENFNGPNKNEQLEQDLRAWVGGLIQQDEKNKREE